uniref:Uncharacterized protein n=1 Tax=Anguilla anguilla TaxID=7936 RepID=A0A0E9WZ26_ANGAN
MVLCFKLEHISMMSNLDFRMNKGNRFFLHYFIGFLQTGSMSCHK